MRVVIDMQAVQGSNATRGIGRYTTALVESLIRNSVSLDIHLLFNATLERSALEQLDKFKDILSRENIHFWKSLDDVKAVDSNNLHNQKISEAIFERKLKKINPDLLLIGSLFEGFADDTLTYVPPRRLYKCAVILFDLIPYIHKDIYLSNPIVAQWYLEKIENLKRADALLAISSSSSQEGVQYLNIPEERIFNISTACSDLFKPFLVNREQFEYLDGKYGIRRQFLMYTGGIDHRKNIDILIQAYSRLESGIREKHQLVIVCSVQEESKNNLRNHARNFGLSDEELVITGYVTDEDLLLLYNACKLFIFPSWHEGFGLPVLEAMQCGKPVLASNLSSLPEVLGCDAASFDPYNVDDITSKISEYIEDQSKLDSLAAHGLERAKKFSWNDCGLKAAEAIKTILPIDKAGVYDLVGGAYTQKKRLKLAFVSPFPPERSGISDYSTELLKVLCIHYDIELISLLEETSDHWLNRQFQIRSLEYFKSDALNFDRILYHFGNSHFHAHMYELMREFPGVMVLHDFFLSGFVSFQEISSKIPHYWTRQLLDSHGFGAVVDRFRSANISDVIYKYPVNLDTVRNSLGVIVHSQHAKELAENWYGYQNACSWNVVPLLKTVGENFRNDLVRESLGLNADDYLICCFGIISPTKINDLILDGYLQSKTAKLRNAVLVFVGFNPPGEYGEKLDKKIKANNNISRIIITGWTEAEEYVSYLSQADCAIQFRTNSRGETSATVLDALKFGIPTITNAHGSLAELDPSTVVQLMENPSVQDVADAIDLLAANPALRQKLSNQAHAYIKSEHFPENCAQEYFYAIEKYYSDASDGLHGLIEDIASELIALSDFRDLSKNLGFNFPPVFRNCQLLIDVTIISCCENFTPVNSRLSDLIRALLLKQSSGVAARLVKWCSKSEQLFYADYFAAEVLGIYDGWISEVPVDVFPGDHIVRLDVQHLGIPLRIIKNYTLNGACVINLISESDGGIEEEYNHKDKCDYTMNVEVDYLKLEQEDNNYYCNSLADSIFNLLSKDGF